MRARLRLRASTTGCAPTTQAGTRARTHARTLTRTRACTRSRMHARTQGRAHKHTPARPHAHTRTRVFLHALAQIDNPGYYFDEAPHAMSPIGGVGIELWTMQVASCVREIGLRSG
eukprot:6196539-Pleurochrysis_carterae.AAC.2